VVCHCLAPPYTEIRGQTIHKQCNINNNRGKKKLQNKIHRPQIRGKKKKKKKKESRRQQNREEENQKGERITP
jgi:adenine specific DNA methylase Mod